MFGTIGDDNKFKLWREDPSQAFQSGRRFRCVYSQSPSNHIAYASFDFLTIKNDVWLAMISHDGLFSLFEPLEPESLTSWKELGFLYPFGQHSRGSDSAFRLTFHQSEQPNFSFVNAGLDPKCLSLAISAANLIKIFRVIKRDDGTYEINEMAEISTDAGSVNDIDWSPGCFHQSDLIAAACDDGCTRVFEVTTPYKKSQIAATSDKHSYTSSNIANPPPSNPRYAPSGIGAGLATASRSRASQGVLGSVRIKHEWKEVASLPHGNGLPVWRVQWVHDGKKFLVLGWTVSANFKTKRERTDCNR